VIRSLTIVVNINIASSSAGLRFYQIYLDGENVMFVSVVNKRKMEKDKEDKEPKLDLDIDLSNFSISKRDNGQHPFLHRIEGFLRPKEIVNQQKRRDEVLKRQKAARRNLINYARQLAGFKPSKEAEDEFKNTEKSTTTPTKSPSKLDYNAADNNISNNTGTPGKSMEEEVLIEEPMGEQMDVQRPRVNKREQNRIKEGKLTRLNNTVTRELIFSFRPELQGPVDDA
jgi:hypothetical protein